MKHIPVLFSRFGSAVAAVFIMAGAPVHAETATAPNSVYAALGETPGIKKIVADLLTLSLHDERIRHTFDDVDMDHLAASLTEQICALTGGPCHYAGKDMRTIHQDLHIDTAQFNALVEDLETAMERNGIAYRAQAKLLALLAPMHRDVVTR